MTTDRPYRNALRWEEAVDEILAENGRQFDPRIVGAFATCEPGLRRLHASSRTSPPRRRLSAPSVHARA
jgi:HD-GYP domain-containing protein (c-di-GMP phosphodiesterase class II)